MTFYNLHLFTKMVHRRSDAPARLPAAAPLTAKNVYIRKLILIEIMRTALFILVILSTLLPVCATWSDNSVVYAVGMGMLKQEAEHMDKDLKLQYDSGEINQTEYKDGIKDYNELAAFWNRFLEGNFNSTIYRKWKLPIR